MNEAPRQITLLHTSDWHLGRTLYQKKRYEEFEAFLSWLAGSLQEHAVDVLVVAGDIFDTNTPSNRAQELYYRFLWQVAASPCRHVVVVGGNHDSPSFLNAPRALLRALNVHVVGSRTADPADEVLVLRDGEGAPELIVCAVPYLRDRDVRVSEAGESFSDKDRKLVEGIRDHYAAVARAAELRLAELGERIPIVATGHLFTAGGSTVEGDGVRETYVGSLAHVDAGSFPGCIDYLALGHLHVPQLVKGSETMRYCGSPLPMGFGEAKQQKIVCLVEFTGGQPSVRPLGVPVFQALEQIRGDWDHIAGRIGELAGENSTSWLEVIYDGAEVMGDLRGRLEEAVAGSALEILRIKDNRVIDRVLGQLHPEETLDDLDEHDVFHRLLDQREVPDEQRSELLRTYGEALASLEQDDARAQ